VEEEEEEEAKGSSIQQDWERKIIHSFIHRKSDGTTIEGEI